MPPPKVAVTVPLDSPLQITSVFVRLRVTTVGVPTVMEELFSQRLASRTHTVCDPAARPVKVYGDDCVAYEPASILTWYGLMPPLKVAVIVPWDSPQQIIPAFVRRRVSALGVPTVMEEL